LRILVTGGAGFIGSHTVDKLIEKKAEVLVIDDLSTGKAENVNPAAHFVKMDITSGHLSQVFQKFKPEYVIHLAAQVSVPKSLEDPVKDCMTNVAGCVNILENCRLLGVRKVVYSSSAAVYGDFGDTKVSESAPVRPLSFYGVSKLSPEYYLQVFYHLYGLKYTVLRYANVYGPRQDAFGEGGVVSIFAARVADKQSPRIFGDGEQARDFVYVEDVAAANIRALDRGDQMILNVGTGVSTSVNRLFSLISEIAGIALKPEYCRAREGDIRHSCMDITNTVAALDWKPDFSLREGLVRTLEYYRS